MDNLIEQIGAADPVDPDVVARVSSEPVFDELFASIVSAGDLPAGADDPGTLRHQGNVLTLRSGTSRRTLWRQGRVLVVAGVAACLAALMLVTVAVLNARTPSRTPAIRPTTAAGHWQLVSDTTSLWQELGSSPPSADSFLACPSATTCYVDDVEPNLAVDAIDVTHDSGKTWQRTVLPVPVWAQVPLSCSDENTCALLGVSANTAPGTPGTPTLLLTTDGGASWSAEPGPSGETSPMDGAALACTSATACLAVTSDEVTGAAAAYLTTDSGATWSTVALPKGFVAQALSCGSASQCALTGFYASRGGDVTSAGAVLVSSDGGNSWTAASVPSGLGTSSTLSCAGSDCVATFFGAGGHTAQVLASTDGGTSWSAVPATGLSNQLVTAVSCPAAKQCWASGIGIPSNPPPGPPVDEVGTLSSTTDGGQSWQQAQLPKGVGRVIDVSCASTTRCYALAMLATSGPTTTTVPFSTGGSGGGSTGGTEVPVLLSYGS